MSLRNRQRGGSSPLFIRDIAELKRKLMELLLSRKRSSDFQGLSDPVFEKLEEEGQDKRPGFQRPIRFSPEIRNDLNERLRRLCGPEGDTLVRAHHKVASQMRASVVRDARKLLATLREMDAAITTGSRLAAWRLFPAARMRQFCEPRVTGEVLGHGLDMAPLIARLESLCGWGEFQVRALTPFSKRGCAPDLWLDWFVIIASDAYTAAGGTVAAGGQEKLGRRESPFLRVLKLIHRHLPAERRAESDAALEARAARSDWKEWTAYRLKAQNSTDQG